MLKLICLSVVFCLLQGCELFVTGQKCDVPIVKSQASPNQPAIRFSTSPVRVSSGFLDRTVTFEDKIFTVKGCVLTLYLKTTLINTDGLTPDFAGDPVTCYKADDGSDQNRIVVAMGMVLKFQANSVDRPEIVPPSWYDGERAVLNLTYSTFPKAVEERMTCEFVVVGPIKLMADVNTTAVGCPNSHWGTRCQNVCPCQNGGRCVGTFSARCRCPTGTSGDHCHNATAAQNGTVSSVSKDGPISSSLTPPVLSTDSPTQDNVNRSVSEGSLQVTRNTYDYQGSGLLDQCHLPPRTSMAVKLEDDAALQFSFDPISVNNRVLHDLTAEDHRYEVRQCQLTVWIRSSPITVTPFLRTLSPSGKGVLCHSSDPFQTIAEASVVYYLGDKAIPRPIPVPTDWYDGTSAVVEISFPSFSPYSNTSLKMSCPFSHNIGNFTIKWGVDIQALGCPVRKWGAYCQNDCQCGSNSYCHTFSGCFLGDPREVISSRPESASSATSRPLISRLFHASMFSLLLLLV